MMTGGMSGRTVGSGGEQGSATYPRSCLPLEEGGSSFGISVADDGACSG